MSKIFSLDSSVTIYKVLEHERRLYSEDKRFTREELIEQRKAYIK